jgi:hypothetical protein
MRTAQDPQPDMRSMHIHNASSVMAACRYRAAAWIFCAAPACPMESFAACAPHAGDVRQATGHASSASLS